MKKIIYLIAFLTFSNVCKSQTVELFFEQTNEFLKKHVSEDGKVDYAKIKKSPGELMYILSQVEHLKTSFTDKNVSKSFWINIYNLQVIKGVVDNYPLESVMKIEGFFKENNFMVANQELTLDDVENTILRELFTDPCVHFVLSSAANGGAPLLNAAYLPETVSQQLKDRAKLFINSKTFMKLDKSAKTVELPKIFDWYKKDFAVNYFNEVDFINIFLEKKIDNKLMIKTYDFDWSLNQR